MKRLTRVDFIIIGVLLAASSLFAAASFLNVNSQRQHVSQLSQITSQMKSNERVAEVLEGINFESHLLEAENKQAYLNTLNRLAMMATNENVELGRQAQEELQSAYLASVVELESIKPKVKSDLREVYSIFSERRYRQRHTARNLATSLRSDVDAALSSESYAPVESFSIKLHRYVESIDSSRVRDSYKARVNPLLEDSLRFIDYEVPSRLNSHLNIAAQNVRDAIYERNYGLKGELLLVIDNEKAQATRTGIVYSLFGFFVLAFAFFSVYLFVKMGTRRLAVVYSMKQRYRERLEKIQKTVRQNMVLKSSQTTSLALINKSGNVVWATNAYSKLFPRTKGQKRNWDKIKSSQMISIADDTNVENSFRLLGGDNSEVIVSEESLGDNSQYRLVIVTPLVSYFSEFNKGIVNSDNIKLESLDQSCCLIDSVIKDSVYGGKINGRKVNGLKLEYEGQLPRFFYDDKKVISETVEGILGALLQAQGLIGFKESDLAINYTKKDRQVKIQFKIYGHRIDQSLLNHSLDTSGYYTSLTDAFEEVERNLLSNYGAVSVSNLSYPDKEVPTFCGIIEVSFAERKAELKETTPKSQLRSRREIDQITM